MNYYNENDPIAAAWLRELITQGHIASGDVDERSIEDVRPTDLRGYRQCHFFAGIGVWSYALRLAAWPDEKEVWTGSCPCQPFSAAGKRAGASDERHLWPAWFWLIRQCRPDVVFGEQVASKDGIAWLDAVSTDMESEGYAIAPTVLPACGVGAPHRRDRTWFVANPDGGNAGEERQQRSGQQRLINADGVSSVVADMPSDGRIERRAESVGRGALPDCELGKPEHLGRRARGINQGCESDNEKRKTPKRKSDSDSASRPGPTNGFWRDAEWIYCRDEKHRAIKPGTFPLVHGASKRVAKLRGIGNAIVAQAAAEVIGAYMEATS